MFAPPPTATLSRAEIQARRAQLQAKRASSTGGTSIGSASELQQPPEAQSSPKHEKKKSGRFAGSKKEVEEIRETDKETWKFKKKLGKGKDKSVGEGGSGTSLPATLLPPPPVPPGQRPPSLRSDAGSYVESIKDDGSGVGIPQAPSPTERRGKGAPPKRPARPSGEMFLSPSLSSSMSDSFPRALAPESGRSFRSSSPATPPPFQTSPPVPGALPMQSSQVASPLATSPKLPPLPSPPLLGTPTSPPPSTPPPPIPEKSPLRQQRAGRRPNSNPTKPTVPRTAVPKKQHTLSTDTGLSSAMAGLRMQDQIFGGQTAGEQQRPPHPLRAATAPAEVSVLTGIKPLQIRKPAAKLGTSSSRSGTGSSKLVTSPTSPAKNNIVPVSKAQRIARQGIRRQVVSHHRRGSSGASVRTAALRGSKNSPTSTAPKIRKANGETMAILQTSGFFSNAPGVVFNPRRPNVNVQLPPAATFVDKDLPTTPNSIAPTPTELYEPSRNSLQVARQRDLSNGSTKRSPLSVVADTDAKSNSSPTPPGLQTTEEFSAHRLTTILDNKSISENSPPPSGTATPVATQIHLRGGSVVTVTPPELTAWQRSIYIQGPIRLPKPVILPRKNSVASMEPFQEAIDRVYQSALFVPRRRSDDAVVDDVCEFFDEFGFHDIGYEGDRLAVENVKVDEVDEMDIDDEADESLGVETERFTTPPGFPPTGDISPIEKVVAKDVADSLMAKTAPIVVLEPPLPPPPVENEETLRARGIARLSQHSAGRSSHSSRANSFKKESPSLSRRTSDAGPSGETAILPLLPPPEESMLDAVLEASQEEEADWVEEIVVEGDAGGMDWDDDDDVEETDVGASWMAPALRKKHALDRGLVGWERRNPVAKMKRFVATATTIL